MTPKEMLERMERAFQGDRRWQHSPKYVRERTQAALRELVEIESNPSIIDGSSIEERIGRAVLDIVEEKL